MSSSFIDLSGRVSVITGAARGIGWAAAHELALAGSAVALIDLNENEAVTAASGLAEDLGVEARGYAADVRSAEALARTIDRLTEFLQGAVKAHPEEKEQCRWCDFRDACRVEEPALISITASVEGAS